MSVPIHLFIGYFQIFAIHLKFAMRSCVHSSREYSNIGGVSIIAIVAERDNV